MNSNPLLTVEELTVSFDSYAGEVKAVDSISFQVYPGEAIGIVGESGCGKSVTAHSIMQLIPTPPGRYAKGKILFGKDDLLQKSEAEMAKIRGNDISIIFQDAMTSLNPVLTIGMQIGESLQLHQHMNKQDAYARAVEMLRLVGIPSPEERIKEYPHQFSGGMRQRVMIAMALSCNPKLLIADEPTTALDVTIQAQILDLMKELQGKLNTAIILISHDLGAIASLCSRVIVMYAGKIAEAGTAIDIFHQPQHPYTWGLLQSLPRIDMMQKQKLSIIPGQPPDLLSPPTGCPFHPRCPHAMSICQEHYPETTVLTKEHMVHCWLQHPDAPKPKREETD
ncbi:ABC transporter ATP-binding protein [Pelosinus fermentans]|uniref:Oligopeptide/dipeptide ABC transporter, ATPase subunit n=1 Tax=Pelosinus fermentans JBW45 TaxID=1192197 RepID=I8U2B9_9FIRM|nr:ABC transporter ATP-binding protein [Pelosinus fermentans]AJQ29870.1 oligopeptide/dipeptide ABC transporter, ATPase subunit [Pelosinus fermentans JBW45]